VRCARSNRPGPTARPAALFLASDEAKYVTATELVVDGGLTAKTA
jgi:NAD(P)-dependent dehydrogenase (short-subunit alcohol dehydrogenase family)